MRQHTLLSRLGQGFAFEDLRSEERLHEGGAVCVATPETLYRMKSNMLRLQDRADAGTTVFCA